MNNINNKTSKNTGLRNDLTFNKNTLKPVQEKTNLDNSSVPSVYNSDISFKAGMSLKAKVLGQNFFQKAKQGLNAVKVRCRLSNLEDNYGSSRFKAHDINKILKHYTPDKEELLNKLLDAKNNNDNFRFNQWDIQKILKHYNPDKKELLNKLLNTKNKDGDFKFNGRQVALLTENSVVFKLLDNKKAIESLSLSEKLSLSKFWANPSYNRNYEVLENLASDVLPPPEKRHQAVKDLMSSIKIKALPAEKIAAFNRAIAGIETPLKNVNLDKFANGLPLDENKKINIPGNPQISDDLNNIADVFKSFKNTIGRPQHGTHKYSLDIHILKTLQKFVKHPEYKNLSPEDKKIGKISILLHDISKKAGEVDKGHPLESAFQSYFETQKLNLSEQERNRVYNIIKNHHWSEEFDKSKDPREIAAEFRHPGDFEIAKIFAEADLKSVNDSFYDQYKGNLKKAQKAVKPLVDKILSTMIYLPQTQIPKASELKLPFQSIGAGSEATQNKIVRINGSQSNLASAGFAKGTNKDNFSAVVHVVDNRDSADLPDFTLKGAEGILSASYANGNNFNTYWDKYVGFVLKADNNNIAAISCENMVSGRQKDFGAFADQLFGEYRTLYSTQMKKSLRIDDQQYVNTLKDLINKPALTDIQDKALASKIQTTIDKNFINKEKHNELIVFSPKASAVFAKLEKNQGYEDIPYGLRKYAQDNDMPVMVFEK